MLMVLIQPEINLGQMPLILPHAVTVLHELEIIGINLVLNHSTRMRTVTQQPDLVVLVVPVVLVVMLVQLVVEEMDNGEKENTSLVLQTLVLNVNYSVLQMIQLNNKLVSTLRSMMIFQSKHLAKMSLSQFSNSQTHLSMTISSRTSSWHITKFQPQFKNTPFQLSWVVVI